MSKRALIKDDVVETIKKEVERLSLEFGLELATTIVLKNVIEIVLEESKGKC